MARDFLPDAQSYHKAWTHWQNIWTRSNLLLGGMSVFLGALVAANTKTPFLPSEWSIGIAVAAPIFTFVLTTLKPQGEAVAFKAAGRELEKALAIYRGDPSKDDTFLTEAIGRGIDILNKVGSA